MLYQGGRSSLHLSFRRYSPRILLMLELCMSGKACRIFLRSSFAQTMKAFIGRLMCGSLLLLPRASLYTRASTTVVPPVRDERKLLVDYCATQPSKTLRSSIWQSIVETAGKGRACWVLWFLFRQSVCPPSAKRWSVFVLFLLCNPSTTKLSTS